MLLTTEQLAETLGVPLTTLVTWRRLRTGPPAVKIGREWRYFSTELDAWISDGGALDHGIDLLPIRGAAGQAVASVGGDAPTEGLLAAGM